MPLVNLVVILLVLGHLLPSLNNKIGARACLTCVRLFFMCEYPLKDTTTQLHKLNPSGFNTMKNTSLFVSFWAMPKGKPSADPAERKCARFRAPDGRQVIGLQALIASYSLSLSAT